MSELIPDDWLQNAKRENRKRLSEKLKARNGDKCSNCKHMTEHAYTKKIVYCNLVNGLRKTKRTEWCHKHEKK